MEEIIYSLIQDNLKLSEIIYCDTLLNIFVFSNVDEHNMSNTNIKTLSLPMLIIIWWLFTCLVINNQSKVIPNAFSGFLEYFIKSENRSMKSSKMIKLELTVPIMPSSLIIR